MAAPYYWLYNFARNISTNISTLGQRTHLKLGELSSIFIVYNTVKPVLSGPHIKLTLAIKRTAVQVPFFFSHVHCKTYVSSTDY